MNADNLKALAQLRLKQAEESLVESKVLLDQGLFRGSVNRAYYAMFYAVQALIILRGQSASKHRGAIALFDQEFIKAGVFDRDLSKWLHQAFNLRQASDYDLEFQASEEKAKETLDQAVKFVENLKNFCRQETNG